VGKPKAKKDLEFYSRRIKENRSPTPILEAGDTQEDNSHAQMKKTQEPQEPQEPHTEPTQMEKTPEDEPHETPMIKTQWRKPWKEEPEAKDRERINIGKE
jgi:hypothetical protein